MTARALKAFSLVLAGAIAASVSVAQLPPSGERFLRRTLKAAPYRLFIPAGYRRGRAYPLVLYLHGGAGRVSDNERQVRDGNGMLIEMFVAAEKEFPALIVAPQTRAEHDVESTLAILERTIAEYRVDRTRIYVVGQSLGGYGALELVAAQPHLFAAAVVVAASGATSLAESVAGVPIWFFHGEKDELIPVDDVRGLVAAVQSAGGTVRFTEYAGEGHGLAWLVARERELVPWVFAQRRTRR